MTDRPPGSAYRDELAAAQARVAVLEERLAERARDEDEDKDEDKDKDEDGPEVVELLEQRRALEKQARRMTHWSWGALAGLVMMLSPTIPLFTLDHPDHMRVLILALLLVPAGLLLGLWMITSRHKRELAILAPHDAKIAEARRRQDDARRLRRMEQEVLALRESRARAASSEQGAPRLRVAAEEDDVEEAEGEPSARAAREL
jgi:hypothetical protein